MKKYDVQVQGHKLIFRECDGWTHDLMESILSTGKLFYREGEWSLSEKHGVSAFDEKRLSDLTQDIFRGGKIIPNRERLYCLKYYSTVGVFEFGEKHSAMDSFGRNGNWV